MDTEAAFQAAIDADPTNGGIGPCSCGTWAFPTGGRTTYLQAETRDVIYKSDTSSRGQIRLVLAEIDHRRPDLDSTGQPVR